MQTDQNEIEAVSPRAGDEHADRQAVRSHATASRIPHLDGWRGLAIVCVLCAHFMRVAPLAGVGVSIFFVLSGRLMSRILFVEKMPLDIFYRRRFARIVPAFWLYISVVFLIEWVSNNRSSLHEFFATAFFLRTYFANPAINSSPLPIQHIWSLNVEEHSYMLLSLLSFIAIRWRKFSAQTALFALSFSCIGFFILYKFHPPAAFRLFFVNRTEIAAFPLILSAGLFLWMANGSLKLPSLCSPLTLVGAILVSYFSTSLFLTFTLVSVLLAISVNTLDTSAVWFRSALSIPVLRWFGVCSYSIYLWQQIFYRDDFLWHGYNLVGVAAALVAGSGSYYLFERPAMRFLRKL